MQSVAQKKHGKSSNSTAAGNLSGSFALCPGRKAAQLFRLNPRGLVVAGTPTKAQWLEAGKALKQAEGALQWWIGDWLNAGERIHGVTYKEAAKLLDYEEPTSLRVLAWVCHKWNSYSREYKLTFKHYKIVAPIIKNCPSCEGKGTLDDEDCDDCNGTGNDPETVGSAETEGTALNWLHQAEVGKWSVARLRQEISEWKRRGEGFPDWLKFQDIWMFPKCDERFGIDFPGRIPGQVVLNVLYYWSAKGDLVIDPMAGGGVTIDACKHWKRRCIAFDIKPVRKNIIKADATEPWPVEEPAQLVFNDPPYWSQLEDDYGGMAQKSYKAFLGDLSKVYRQAHEHLTDDGILAVLIAPMAVKTEHYQDTPFDLVKLCGSCGFSFERRISVPVSSQQVGPNTVKKCKEEGGLVALLRDLLIFKKEAV